MESEDKLLSQKSPKKISSLYKSPSTSKKQHNKLNGSILSQIENRAPEIQHTSSVSGRRNVKRIKEI